VFTNQLSFNNQLTALGYYSPMVHSRVFVAAAFIILAATATAANRDPAKGGRVPDSFKAGTGIETLAYY